MREQKTRGIVTESRHINASPAYIEAITNKITINLMLRMDPKQKTITTTTKPPNTEN